MTKNAAHEPNRTIRFWASVIEASAAAVAIHYAAPWQRPAPLPSASQRQPRNSGGVCTA